MGSQATAEDETNSEFDSSQLSQPSIRTTRTESSFTQRHPTIPVQQLMQLLSHDLPELPAFLPTNNANLRALVPNTELQYLPPIFPPINVNLHALMLHRELQYRYSPWADAQSSFQSAIINPHVLPPFTATQAIEPHSDMQQLIRSIHNSNLIRQYHDQLSSHIQATILQENLANHQAMLSRHVYEELPIAAYLRSRSIVRDSWGVQNSAIPDPLPPGQILPQLLAQPEDQSSLSKFQALLRQNIEVFQATSDEARIHLRGRNSPIYIHQVGIRCIHCKHVPMERRQKGSMYFPSNTLRIYQAAQNMATSHILSGLCAEMPDHVNEQFQMLMAARSTCGKGGRVYWAQSAEIHLGLVNTPEGIRATAAAAVL